MRFKKIKSIIEDTDTKSGKGFDIFIQILILVSILSFCFETLPDLNKSISQFLKNLEYIIVIIFTLEYILRISVSSNKKKYLFSFYSIIDLIAILPFYLSMGIDLRSVRIFRLLRLIRTFKLLRYSNSITRFYKAFGLIKAELVLFSIVCFFLLFISSVGIYYFENPQQPDVFKSVFHSMWWAVATLSTVGYGDIIPITLGGKIFASMILFIGLGIVAVPSGLIASALTKVLKEEKMDE